MRNSVALALLLSVFAAPVVATSSPNRVVSLSPHITELVFAAGAGDHLIAVDKYSDWPEEATTLPVIGDAYTLNAEHLLSLQPDLVLLWESGTSPDKLKQIQRLNIPFELFEPDGMMSIADDIERIGRLFGTQGQARRAAETYREEIRNEVEKNLNKQKVTVFHQVDEYPLYTSGHGHIIDQAITACGGVNIFSDLSAIPPPVSVEAVIARKPALIVATVKDLAARKRINQSWSKLSFLPAVANKQVKFVDPDLLTRPSPRFALGLKALCLVIDQARTE